MSDFFGRLAARALGLAQALEPRVPYRFEHAASAVPASPPDEPEEERSGDNGGCGPAGKDAFRGSALSGWRADAARAASHGEYASHFCSHCATCANREDVGRP